MNMLQRYRRRRWMRRYAFAIVRHSGIGWDEAQGMANAVLERQPSALTWLHPTDAALIELGIYEEGIL